MTERLGVDRIGVMLQPRNGERDSASAGLSGVWYGPKMDVDMLAGGADGGR